MSGPVSTIRLVSGALLGPDCPAATRIIGVSIYDSRGIELPAARVSTETQTCTIYLSLPSSSAQSLASNVVLELRADTDFSFDSLSAPRGVAVTRSARGGNPLF